MPVTPTESGWRSPAPSGRPTRDEYAPAPAADVDENLWARHAGAEERPLPALLAEYQAVRASSTPATFASLPREAWRRRGVSNGDPVTVRGLGFQIAGHEWHHVRIPRERYLPLLSDGLD